MDAKTLIPRLTSEFGYPPQGAQLVATKIAAFTPDIRESFATWWTTGNLPETEVAGYTLTKLMNEHSMKPIAAFLTLDWLAREPDKALSSLKKGHDLLSLS